MITVPMSMNIGAPAKPVVKPGLLEQLGPVDHVVGVVDHGAGVGGDVGLALRAVDDDGVHPVRVHVYGGPMMGTSVPSLEAPVMKNTNAILAFDALFI